MSSVQPYPEAYPEAYAAEHGRFAVVPAAYVLLLRDGAHGREVLLQLRRGTGYMDEHWAAAAAGHVERGETALEAARREAREEIGVEVDDLKLVTTMQRTGGGPAIDERVDFFFTATSWSGEPAVREPDKSAGLRWWPLDALPEPVVPHERTVLGAVRDAATVPFTTFGFHPAPPHQETA